jgi:Rrf2 family transcriptional regulator, iron-sulfur cluster assembly transcription factor
LPPRHLESLLQGLAQANILTGVRGPRGGYKLARERQGITALEIVRSAMAQSKINPYDVGAHSALFEQVIEPAVSEAGKTFIANLDAITVEQMCATAETARVLEDEKVSGLVRPL